MTRFPVPLLPRYNPRRGRVLRIVLGVLVLVVIFGALGLLAAWKI